MLTRRFQLLFIAALILAAYYPILSAGFSAIDDYTIIAGYAHVKEWNFWASIVPSGGLYFRPLIGISFLIDKLLLGLDPAWMHLENVFLHLLNTILVYFLARLILPLKSRGESYAPLLAALVFGLHPINTESVNWISGRTDVLATSFILLSALLLINFKECGRKRYLSLSLLALFAAAFAKETALAFLPGIILIIGATEHTEHTKNAVSKQSGKQVLNSTMALLLGSILIAFVAFMARSGDFIAHQSRMSITLRFIVNDWMHTMFVVLRAFGFYMKKLIFPFPLNFAIMEVDPLYELIAVPMVAACFYIASRRSILSGLFFAGVLLIAPAFVLALGQIAWTPYAERYVYTASALLVPSIVVFLRDRVQAQHVRIVKIAMGALIVIMFVAVVSRSIVWSNDFTLAKDTVEKSPMSRDMRALYGSLLCLKRRRYAEALRQLEQGKKSLILVMMLALI